ncbi:MAG: hypothetical protein ACT4PQ_09760 [Betaproteobacteria bacterium]
MKLKLRGFFLYYLPLLANLGLIAYLTWQLNLVPYFQRQGEFQIFSVLYAVGGLVIAVSGVTSFVHAVSNEKGPRNLFMLSLLNTIIPTVLLLALLQLR